MPVSKHDIEWLINVISEYDHVLPSQLIESARKLITESNYRKSVCVIHPVNEKAYASVRKEIKDHLDSEPLKKTATENRTKSKVPDSTKKNDPFSNCTWIQADDKDNPFNMLLVDCAPFCQTRISATLNADIAFSYMDQRENDGTCYRGQHPPNWQRIPCNLKYPAWIFTKFPTEILFKANQMEDKWDIYCYDDILFFCSSWTGDLLLKAPLVSTREGDFIIIPFVEATTSHHMTDIEVAAQQVDFLLKSLLRVMVPCPVPTSVEEDIKEMTEYAFTIYGRFAHMATHDDTSKILILPSGRLSLDGKTSI